MFHESVKKTVKLKFNLKMHCEINVKLVFHEMQGKKNFTVYSSLNKFQRTENVQKQLFRSILQDSFFKILKYSQETLWWRLFLHRKVL